MDDFETFKASREKIDPAARKFSESQWEQAYAAYRSSRERLKDGHSTQAEPGQSSRRRSSLKGRSGKRVAAHRVTVSWRSELRHHSAYSDLRMLVDLLAWIVIALAVLAGALKLVYYTNVSAALVAILEALMMVIAVVALRLMAHVVIDIPDIALQKGKPGSSRGSAESDANH